jgi:hypothetical protein
MATPQIYRDPGPTGGNRLTVGATGEIYISAGGKITAAGTQASHIADASTAHALNATFSDTEVEAALNALGTKINAILAALENTGILASS